MRVSGQPSLHKEILAQYINKEKLINDKHLEIANFCDRDTIHNNWMCLRKWKALLKASSNLLHCSNSSFLLMTTQCFPLFMFIYHILIYNIIYFTNPTRFCLFCLQNYLSWSLQRCWACGIGVFYLDSLQEGYRSCSRPLSFLDSGFSTFSPWSHFCPFAVWGKLYM